VPGSTGGVTKTQAAGRPHRSRTSKLQPQPADPYKGKASALTETLDGVGKYLAREMPNSLLTQKVRAVLAAAGSSTAAPCSECDGRGEVAVTRGMPGDGPMQCPACAGSSANPEESEA
jgi:DnaJ-class molecular chaperone